MLDTVKKLMGRTKKNLFPSEISKCRIGLTEIIFTYELENLSLQEITQLEKKKKKKWQKLNAVELK